MGEKKQKKVKEQSRKWLMTINNPDVHGFDHVAIKKVLGLIENVDYWCMCDEVGGKTNCYHTHIFIYRKKSPISFSFLKKLFPVAHFDYPYGTAQQNRDYIRKEGEYANSEKALTNLIDTFEEFGDCPQEQQGKRNDLISLYGMISDGLSDYEILEENPNYMVRLNTISKVREIQLYEKFKKTRRLDLRVEYWTGPPGVGKTRSIMDNYGDGNVYRVTDSRNPWDTYRGQDVVVFEEFYSESFALSDMLNWLDIYPCDLPCRYNNKVACFTKVFITSNRPLDDQYRDWQRESPLSWQAFLRRFSCIKVFSADGYIQEYKTLDDLKHSFVPLTLE